MKLFRKLKLILGVLCLLLLIGSVMPTAAFAWGYDHCVGSWDCGWWARFYHIVDDIIYALLY